MKNRAIETKIATGSRAIRLPPPEEFRGSNFFLIYLAENFRLCCLTGDVIPARQLTIRSWRAGKGTPFKPTKPTKQMKPIPLLLTSLFAAAALACADGIPVNRKTGEVTVAHTIVSLTPEQVEETQSLGTFTLTPEHWREIRAKSPTCPKRFENIFTAEFNECCCECGPYVIARAPDRFAVLTCDNSGVSPDSVRQQLFKSHSYIQDSGTRCFGR